MMVERRWRAWVVLVTAPVLCSLVALAHATPPDQTWIRGFYDDADYDDVVLLAMSAVGVLDVAAPIDGNGIRIAVDMVASLALAAPRAPEAGPPLARAPPLA